MDAWVWIVIAVVAVLVIGLILWAAARNRRTRGLRDQFGPEYERTMQEMDGRRAAESELVERRERREYLDIRPLTPAARDRFAQAWLQIQAHFVDGPSSALREADTLVLELMRERGYPMDDFEQRAADISVDHPRVVENYREAHAVSQRTAGGDATTEEMRRGMVHYRSLFEELLEVDPASTPRGSEVSDAAG